MLRMSDEQWELIRKHFPEKHYPDDRPGRKPIPARRVLGAVLWIRGEVGPQSALDIKALYFSLNGVTSSRAISMLLTPMIARTKQLLAKMRRRISSIALTKGACRHALVGPARLWKMKRDFQIRFLRDVGLKPEHYVLDIGCGTLRGGVPVIQYLENYHYFGVEVRESTLAEGRKELREAGLEGKSPTLLLSPDISQLTLDRTFDYIWAFSVLIHMGDEILGDTLAFVRRYLSEEGVFYANVTIGDENEGYWQGFPVVTRTLEFYSRACAASGLAATDLGALKELGHIANVESQDSQRMLKIVRMA